VTVPASIEGFRIGPRLRESGALFVHSGTSRLELPVEASFAETGALTKGFEADDFLAGVRRAAAIHHEALLPFVTGGTTEGLVYAIAKTLEGGTLPDVVAKDGPLPETGALALAAALTGALAALERGGMRHGDLSPSRIIVAGPATFVVGPPRLLPASLAPRDDRWQAPEEARGGEHGVQSDLFVVGLILVFAMTGAQPLGDAADARRALRDWKTPDVAVLLRRAGPETRSVVAKLLAAESANRFASAAEALRAVQDAASAAAAPETAPIVPPAGAPAPRSAPETAKRPPGRLCVESRLGEAVLEIDDDALYVGANPAKNVRAQPETFPEAAIRVERTAAADVVYAMSGGLSVNGAPVESHPLADGDRVEAQGVVARYERAPRAPQRTPRAAAADAPPPNRAAGPIVVVAIVGTMAALAWGVLRVTAVMRQSSDAESAAARSEQALAEEKRLAGPPETSSAAPSAAAVQAERAARDAYQEAAQWARRHPADAREKYYEVWQRFSETGYGLLGRLDAMEIDRLAKAPPDQTFETLLAQAEAADGSVDDETLMKLRGYVEEHPGTLVGERAHVALVKAQAILRGRLDADFAAINAAIARKDWREAKLLVGKVRDYAPASLLDDVQAFVDKIVKGMGETLLESPGGGAHPEGGAKPKDAAAGKADAAERNRKAEEIFRNARRAMDGGKDVEALEGFLTFLREYKDTPAGAKYDPETRGRISTLSAGPAGIVKLFRGKVEKADNKGRWRIAYDFSDAEQIKDFKDVAAFEAPPRAIWKAEDGAVKNVRGSGAFVLDAVFKPDEISTSVVVNPKRPHDLGILYMDPSEQRRFYLFTLQNTFFTLGKGDAAKPFLENAIVLFGPNMWRDTPPGALGYVRKCGADEPIVREAEPTPIRAGKSDAEVWMKFEGGRSIRGSAYGDTKYDFPGVMPGLFVIGSEGYFDDFVVEGVPDMDWVQKRWRAILSGL
jgi:hypothetical protein